MSGIGRRGWVLCGTLVGAFVAYQALDIAWARDVFHPVPATRDPRLVGRWRGVWTRGSPRADEVVLQADGTIHAKDGVDASSFARAEWGTERDFPT